MLLPTISAVAAIPAPERLLPDDTIFLVTAPDFSKLRLAFKNSPESRFWNDPAMKLFREHFMDRLQQDVLKPLKRELSLSLGDYLSLAQGQVTFAITENGWSGRPDDELGALLLVDTRDKSSQLKTNLTELRQHWAVSGKAVRTQKVRGCELTVISLDSNDLPGTLRQFLPQPSEIQELGPDGAAVETKPPKMELIIGQSGSLLLIGTAMPPMEKVLARLGGGELPSLSDVAAYHASHLKLFRDAPFYAWANVKLFMDSLNRATSTPGESLDPIAPPSAEKMLDAFGLRGVTSAAFAVHASSDGQLFDLYVAAPESTRQGIFKVLTGTPKDASPPPFVPADAVKFQRWRGSLRGAWAAYQKMQNDVSPGSGFDTLIDTATDRAREKDPGYDLRKALLSNLGDDVITYERAPRGTSTGDLRAPPSILLLGSPQPQQLAGALKIMFGIFAGSDAATEREFLGHKIFTTPFPGLPIPLLDTSRMLGKNLSYAAAGAYVALSTDDSMLEEFLRSSEGQGKSLRDVPGFRAAVARVTDPSSDLLGFEDRSETLRAIYEAARLHPAVVTNTPPPNPNNLMGAVPFAGPDKTIKDWMDFSLLPPFERISQYFYFEVYGGSSSVDGLTWRQFAPTPPALRETTIGAK